MVSDETLLSYPYCMTPFTVNIDTSDKHLVGVLSHNDEPITSMIAVPEEIGRASCRLQL